MSSTVKKIKVGDWEQLWDATYQAAYFYNVKSKQSQWERPASFPDLTAARAPPTWVDPSPVSKYIQEPMESFQKRLMKRRARVQMDPAEIKKFYLQGGENYNIWYDNYIGENGKKDSRDLSTTKCDMGKDCGHTKADEYDPKALRNVFCLHFAKGRCSKGAECTFFHRIPDESDAKRFDSSTDCFGRDRHKEHKEDMGGTGSFNLDCTTLYCGGVRVDEGTEAALWRNFCEWGTPKNINIVERLRIAFVTYNTRQNAEFAKVAMAGQTLDAKEVLNLRWAYDDPNPKAVREKFDDQVDALLTKAEERELGVARVGDVVVPSYLQPFDGQAVGYYPINTTIEDTNTIGPQKPAHSIEQQKENHRIAESLSLLDKAFNRIDHENERKRKAEDVDAD